MSIKLYARQVPDAERMSEFDYDAWPEVMFYGNRDYKSKKTLLFQCIRENMTEASCIAHIPRFMYEQGYSTIAEAFDDLFFLGYEVPCSDEQAEAIAKALKAYAVNDDEDECCCSILSVITGNEWKWRCIRGSSQDEWQNVCYPADEYTGEDIGLLESEYFGGGSEWEVYEGLENAEINRASDLDGFSPESCCVCSSSEADEVKRELGKLFGCLPEEVALFFLTGSKIKVVYTYGEAV